MRNSSILLIACFGFIPKLLLAQTLAIETTAAAGETFKTNVGAIVWTLGEPVVEAFSNQASIGQGFHQGYGLATPVYEAPFMDIQIKVFPNPVVDWLNIETNAANPLQAQFFDLLGRLIRREILVGQREKIDLSLLPTGNYLLNLSNEQGLIQSYKIQKINF